MFFKFHQSGIRAKFDLAGPIEGARVRDGEHDPATDSEADEDQLRQLEYPDESLARLARLVGSRREWLH